MTPRMTLLGVLVVVLAACSSGGGSQPIDFEHTVDMPTGTAAWIATGDAVDDGAICASATGSTIAFEDEDGNVRTIGEIDALNQGSDPFVSVSVDEMTCADGSGGFTLRFINSVDPTLVEAHGITGVSWTITGGTGYEAMEGGGDAGIPQFQDITVVYSASGDVKSG